MNLAEILLETHLVEADISFRREVKLIDNRRFLWDFVIGDLAIEIQGGIWLAKGAHNTGKAIERDVIKARLAVKAGYIPIHFITKEVMDGTAINWIKDYKKEL